MLIIILVQTFKRRLLSRLWWFISSKSFRSAFNCCLQLWIPVYVCALLAAVWQHLLFSSKSNFSKSFLIQLPYCRTTILLLCQIPVLSKLYLKAVTNTVLGRNFAFEFIWKKQCSASFRILQLFEDCFLHFDTTFFIGFFFFHGFSALHFQPKETDNVRCHPTELPSDDRMLWLLCSASLVIKPMEIASTWSYLVTSVCAGNLKPYFWGNSAFWASSFMCWVCLTRLA